MCGTLHSRKIMKIKIISVMLTLQVRSSVHGTCNDVLRLKYEANYNSEQLW
jgi:hypothetical protein